MEMKRALLILFCAFCARTDDGSSFFCHAALALEPGVGLRSRDGSMLVVIFEHTEQFGTGGLVLNQPTPLRLRDLEIPRFHKAFADHSLMLGGGLSTNNNKRETNVALTEMAPWFWLHNIPDLPKSTLLHGAQGPLFLGGNIDVATEWILKDKKISAESFKFFYKYKQWGPGELVSEIAQTDQWKEVGPIRPEEAIQMHSFPRVW